ncbi:MAG: hypothetical protein IPO88_27825 [Nannocystis sp.]|uniref:hypothetical protein n=1 Tax=Nannocystis sp. TaxID=1962667 RepID=UPI0024288533|nr:hypothetical protein [Nannocystis sp.]MBK9757239.1 hypothetical protein [Nannocystis sp.]
MVILDARILAPFAVLLFVGCPGQPGGDDSGTSTGTGASTMTPTSTTNSTTNSSPTGSSTADTPDPTTAGSTAGSTAGDTSGTTGAVDTTGGDETSEPIDVTCTYPGSTSEGPLAPDVAPECACVDAQGSLVCKSPLCPSISGKCSGGDIFQQQCHGSWSYDEAALDCALAAARDGLEGTLYWYFAPNNGFSEHYGFLHIVSERRAIRQDVNWIDLGGEVSDTQLWQLKDAAYFQGCIDLPTFCERLACFFAGTEAIALSLCLPGFYDWDF